MINVVDLTQKLVRCASVTPEDAGAQDVLKEPLRDLGFEIFDLHFDGDGSYPVKNFFARRGTSAPHFCFCGHTDVVPAGDETLWTHPPFDAVIDDGKIYGRGAADMKGADAVFIASIDKFLQDNPNFDGSLSVLIIGDEEKDRINGARRATKWLTENNHEPDFCIVGEASNTREMGEAIKVGRRGNFIAELTVFGKQGHVAYPENADNPMVKICKIGNALQSVQLDKGTNVFDPSNLEVISIDVGNEVDNIIPAQGKISFNIRYNVTWNEDTLIEKIKSLIDPITIDYKLNASATTPPFVTEPDAWTDEIAQIIERHTGKYPEYSTAGGTSDAPFIAPISQVIEFGMINETYHQTDEHVHIEHLQKLTDIYVDILNKFFISKNSFKAK